MTAIGETEPLTAQARKARCWPDPDTRKIGIRVALGPFRSLVNLEQGANGLPLLWKSNYRTTDLRVSNVISLEAR